MFIKTMWINWTFLNSIVIRCYANKVAQQYKTAISCLTCVANCAVDGDIKTCAQLEGIGTTSPDKSTWWYVDLGGRYNVYNIRIQFMDYGQSYITRQRGRFAGFSLYVANTTERHSGYRCYKDWTELPPLDFNINCITNGRYVIFYNERLSGTKYPLDYEISTVFSELCEVTVTGCSSSGVYGNHCDKPCPENCQERRCDIINGTCFGCKPGWLGEYCNTECPLGTYGPDCMYKCSVECLGDTACNRVTGKCDTGCNIGYTGEVCVTADLESNAVSDNCNEPSYIAGLSVLVILCIVLGSVCLIFMWKYHKLVKKMRSLQYTSIIRTSTQDNNANSCQQYEELRISEDGYHNIKLRN